MSNSVRGSVEGGDALRSALSRIGSDHKSQIMRAVAISGEELRTECLKVIQQGGRSGRIYKRGKIVHQASAPGEPPKTDTGFLVSHIFARPIEGGMTYEVGTNVDYGTFLEYGTAKMAARPWLFPTFERLKAKITARIESAIHSAMRS